MSHGEIETDLLRNNLETQLDRLMEQLEDLEKEQNVMDEDEYQDAKEDTMEQLKELNKSLSKLIKGDISLISTLGAVKLATQLAIAEAFKTPEVIRLFARREPKALRQRLTNIKEDLRLGKISVEFYERQTAEILTALQQLGDQLTKEELQLLEKFNDISKAMKNVEFIEVEDE